MRTPLAWKNLTSSLGKCVLAAIGVGFAVVLMFMQIGFRYALIDNNVQLFSLFDPSVAKVAIISRARYNVATEQRFPRRVVDVALTVSGVESAMTVSLERGAASIAIDGRRARPIRVLGVDVSDATQPFFQQSQVYERLVEARGQGGALVDSRSKSSYGFASDLSELRQHVAELNGKRLPLEDYFALGTDFGNDGTLLMSEETLASYFPWRSATGDPTDAVDIALLSVRDEADVASVARAIQSLAPSQVVVMPTADLIEKERAFWATKTPIGKIFLIGTIMGLFVGAIICYQIQFTDISEHMPEFATLKAMGYGPGYFWSIVLWQSFYLACLGFLPGIIVSLGLYQLLAHFSGLLMIMTLQRVLVVWALTLLMCAISGSLAIRKLFNSDPASLF